MFYDCPKLQYVDFSSLLGYSSYYGEIKVFNKNISKNGVLVLNEEFHHIYAYEVYDIYPNGWTLNFVNLTNYPLFYGNYFNYEQID